MMNKYIMRDILPLGFTFQIDFLIVKISLLNVFLKVEMCTVMGNMYLT